MINKTLKKLIKDALNSNDNDIKSELICIAVGCSLTINTIKLINIIAEDVISSFKGKIDDEILYLFEAFKDIDNHIIYSNVHEINFDKFKVLDIARASKDARYASLCYLLAGVMHLLDHSLCVSCIRGVSIDAYARNNDCYDYILELMLKLEYERF